jgi:hypothetical protein
MTHHHSQFHTDDYDVPDATLIERALERLGNPQHRRFFYTRLENPKWVKPLAAHGAFTELPNGTVDENGGTRFEAWPQGEYLARMADLVPDEVATVLVQDSFAHTDNPIVQRSVIEAASRMPAAQARRAVDAICAYLTGPHRRYLDPGTLVALVVVLAEGGQGKPAKKLAQAIYRHDGRNGNIEGAGLDPHWYAETLPQVVSALKSDPKTLNMVAVWLDLWAASDALAPSMRSMWRDAIEAGQPGTFDHMTYQVGHALVDAVRNLARARIDANAPLREILAVYENGKNSIFSRLALDALFYAATRGLVSVQDTDELDARSLDGIFALAFERLANPELLAGEFRPEYLRLARTVLPHLSEPQLEQWQQLIAHPPHLTAERVARRFAVGENEISAEQVETYVGRWERDLLAEIGRAALSARQGDRLAELTGSYGQPPEFGRAPAHASFVADTSPLGDAELAELGPEELAAFVGTWEPAPTSLFGGPSPEGLARSIGRVVAADPAPYAQQAGVFAGLGPGYVGALLDGLREAVGQQRIFPWVPVLGLIADCATQRDQQQVEADATWRFTLQQAADLVRLGLNPQPGGIAPELYNAAWTALEPITKSPHPTCEEEQAYGPPSTDALTFSLNSTRPVALRAAIRLLLSIQRQSERTEPDDTEGTLQTVASAVLAAIEEHAGPDKDESLTAAAVFGEGLGTLLTAVPDWTLERLERLLGPTDVTVPTEAEQAWFETAWNVMLVGYRPSRGLFEPLEPWFMRHLAALAHERVESAATFSMRSPRQALADHVLVLFVTGQIEGGLGDRALGALFEFGDTALVRNALGHLGWALRHDQGEIPDTVLARFRELWDWRRQQVDDGNAKRQELLDFYWWVTSGRFDADWWLPRLLFVAQDPEFTTHAMLGKFLAQAATAHPAEVLDVFNTLHENGQTMTSYDLLGHAPAILAPSVTSLDEELSRRAVALADQMGREGFVDLMDRIRALPGQAAQDGQDT